jgi:hypothetical protein
MVYIVHTMNKLSEEYEKALLWFNNVLFEKNYKIEKLDNLELIIFFNLWIISYYILRYRHNDYADLEKYGYKIMDFIEFIKDFEVIKKKYPNFIYNRIYRNYNDYNFDEDDYKFCHKLLRTSFYNIEYFIIVNKTIYDPVFYNKTIYDPVFYNNECNLKNMIVNKYLIKII